jgi:hypothetical protein
MKMIAEEAGTAVALDKAAEQAHSSSDAAATKCFESAYGKGSGADNKPNPSGEGGIKPELGPKKFNEKEQSGILEIPPIGKELGKENADGKKADGKHGSASPDGELKKENVAVERLNGMDKSKIDGGASGEAVKRGEIGESLGKRKQVLDGGAKDYDNKSAELKSATKEGVIKDHKE